jgi:hypothetical protein
VTGDGGGDAWDARGKVLPLYFMIEEILGRLVGFEPTTSAATERRSATEL